MKQEVVREQILSAMPEAPAEKSPEDPKKLSLAVMELEKRLAPSGGGQVGWGC